MISFIMSLKTQVHLPKEKLRKTRNHIIIEVTQVLGPALPKIVCVSLTIQFISLSLHFHKMKDYVQVISRVSSSASIPGLQHSVDKHTKQSLIISLRSHLGGQFNILLES